MKKADNFDPSKWLVENKLTTQSRLNEEETLTPAQRAALTRAKNKKEDEERKLRFRAADKARQEEEQNRRAKMKFGVSEGMVLAASHADEKAHPGIHVLHPWPGATPGMRIH